MASSLYHTLNVGSEALLANRQGVDTAGHNIANAQTEGYSRQRVNVEARHPSETRGIIIGNGAYAKSITRAHDKFVEKQVNLATQDSGSSKARHDALSQVESIYNLDRDASVSEQMTHFFNMLQALAAHPAETSVRTNLREAGQDLATAFRSNDNMLLRQKMDLNEQVFESAREISEIVGQIAALNVEIVTTEAGRGGQANDLRDQQDKLLRELSEKIDVDYYLSNHGTMVVRGPSETLLVDGRYFSQVATRVNADTNMYDLVVVDPENGGFTNITPHIERGSLKAVVDVRDKDIARFMEKNNILAASVAHHVNSVHARGYGVGDYKESVGREFFKISPDISQAAQSLGVSDAIMDSVDAIGAAATPAAPGDNVIINELLKLRDAPIMDNSMSFNEYYSTVMGEIGLEVDRAKNQMKSDDVVLADLSKRRESIAGVSLDEEAINLLRWQTAFAASSKVITTADEMLETVLGLKR